MRDLVVVEELKTSINGKSCYAIKPNSSVNRYHTYNCDNPLHQIQDAYYVYDSLKLAEKAAYIICSLIALGFSYSNICLECARLNMITRRTK
jgi:hypothetical protein